MNEIYVLVYKSMITEVYTASTDFEKIVDYLDTKVRRYNISDCHIEVYEDGGKRIREISAEDTIRKHWLNNVLTLPSIDLEKLIEKEIDEKYLVKNGIKFGIDEDKGYDNGEMTVEVYHGEDSKPEKIIFWLSSKDYKKSLKNSKHLENLINKGNYKVNAGNSTTPYKCQTLKFVQ